MAKKLEDYSREELIGEIKALKRRKKFGLVWEDKKEDIVEKCKNEIPVLKEVPGLAINEKPGEPTNLIIEGDNFASLQVLNYTHHEKIDVIYIDPPYNTGNKDFIYNDSYVDSEDSFRHSKWLSFMDRRLRLAKELLSDDGVIFISIDDNEQAKLLSLCNDIFTEENFIDCFVWRRSGTGGLRGVFPVTTHEYCLCYVKNKNKIQDKWMSPYSEKSLSAFNNEDEKGRYKTQALYLTSLKQINNQAYYISLPDGTRAKPPVGVGAWRYIEDSYNEELEKGNILFKETSTSPLILENGEKAKYSVYTKQYISDDGTNPPTIFPEEIVGQTRAARAEIKRIFGKDMFNYAKPSSLIMYLLQLVNKNKEITILDFFAGSGTTGQAVLELNKDDGGNRTFILCTNNESNIARDVTYPRIKTVVTGIRPDGSKYSDGIPANVRYFTTDFIEKGITGDATRAKLFEKSDEMIQVRENVFELVDKNDDYTFYKNSEKFVAIIKDPFNFGPIWYALEEKNTEKLPVKLYVFSYSNYTFEDEIPDTDLKYEICAIPNSIMEVYRKISDKKEER